MRMCLYDCNIIINNMYWNDKLIEFYIINRDPLDNISGMLAIYREEGYSRDVRI